MSLDPLWKKVFDDLQENLRRPHRHDLGATFIEFSNLLRDELIRLTHSVEFVDSRVKIALCVHERTILLVYIFIDGQPVLFQYMHKLTEAAIKVMLTEVTPYLTISTVKRLT